MTKHDNLHVLLRHAWVFSVDPRKDLFLRTCFVRTELCGFLPQRNGTAPSSQCTMSTRMCTMSSNGQQPF